MQQINFTEQEIRITELALHQVRLQAEINLLDKTGNKQDNTHALAVCKKVLEKISKKGA